MAIGLSITVDLSVLPAKAEPKIGKWIDDRSGPEFSSPARLESGGA